MNPKIIRLNEAALYKIGFDPVTVHAFRNLVRVVGDVAEGPTLPEMDEKAKETDRLIGVLQENVAVLQGILDILQSAPMQTDEPRGEQFGTDPIAQPVPEISQIYTEVRQIAEAQAVLASQIQDIKQGIML